MFETFGFPIKSQDFTVIFMGAFTTFQLPKKKQQEEDFT